MAKVIRVDEDRREDAVTGAFAGATIQGAVPQI